MKLKRLTYIGLFALLAASCAKEALGERTLSETGEKTPITVVTNLTASKAATKAVDAEFETNDLLNAYIKHVTVADASANPLVYSADVTGTGVGPRLANFKVSALTDDHKNAADNWTNHSETSTLTVTDAQGLYWDDFSNSASGDTDLRTDKHALMVYYGYGYNGSPAYGEVGTSFTADLNQADGTLGWKVATDQSSGFKTSDLLYAGQQTPVAYAHGTNNTIDGRDRVLTVPYTHAMSKVTVVVKCEDGFEADATKNFGGAEVKLYQAGTAATVTAPSREVSKGTTLADVTMCKLTPEDKQCSFSAIIAPTLVKGGETFATISGVDGNNYTLKLSDATITTATAPENAWSTQLAAYDAATVTPDAAAAYTAANGGLTKPGVHYMITVTIKKQEIKVKATIANWVAVTAEGNGEILFDSDVKDVPDGIAGDLKTNGFDVYKSTTTTFGTKATTFSWNTTESKWENSPKIYWEGGATSEYFRALSGAVEDDPATDGINESLAMEQSRDVLWGTTPKHTGKDVDNHDYTYEKGAAIKPRTGNVPLEFEHAMSKISVTLSSPAGLTEVNLNNAKIDIINIYNEGKLNLYTGDIEDLDLKLTPPAVYTISGTVTENDGKYEWLNNVVIPQSLTKDNGGNVRTVAPVFYQSGELTKIYNDGTSMPSGGGDGTYYLTSTLETVPYEASELTAIYADGTSIDDGSGNSVTYVTSSLEQVDPVYYAQDEIDAAKAIVDAVTADVIAASNAKAGDVKTPASSDYEPAEYYTQDEIDDAKAKVAAATDEVRTTAAATAGAVKIAQKGTAAVYYTQDEIDEAKAIVEAADYVTGSNPAAEVAATKTTSDIKTPASADYEPAVLYTQAEIDAAKAIVDAVTSEVLTAANAQEGDLKKAQVGTAPVLYTQTEIDEAKAKVAARTPEIQAIATKNTSDVKVAGYYRVKDGSIQANEGDLKCYKTNSGSEVHSPGELKTQGNMIMMYITLNNGTRYKLELSKCKDSSSNAIDTWVRGKEYQYTITLGKEEIKFRALIKDWDKTEGSGNATIDWD